MLEAAFRRYLRDVKQYGNGTIQSRISNCRNVEQHEGNLDEHFENDHCQSLLERLTYSKNDADRKIPPQHKIPIKGNLRNGTATLKSAVTLYQAFLFSHCNGQAMVKPMLGEKRQQKKASTQWPQWPHPNEAEIRQLAETLTPFVKFLHPDIISAVVEDNRLHYAKWSAKLHQLGINSGIYLWDGSPCGFPGVRRYAGSREFTWFKKKSQSSHFKPPHCICLDDNDYPKHLWAFIFTGKPFRKQGPQSYHLAHLADHKEHQNRWKYDFNVTEGVEGPPLLFGLFTSPANTVYVPFNFLRPTDTGTLRTLLLQKAYQLYGDVCQFAPPPLMEKSLENPIWNPNNFNWSNPVGTTENISNFLDYRNRRIEELFDSTKTE